MSAKMRVAGSVEKAWHELIASGLAAILDIVEPEMRAAARAVQSGDS